MLIIDDAVMRDARRARPARSSATVDDEPTWVHSTVLCSHAGVEQRVPVLGVDARHAEPGRVLGERDRVAALGSTSRKEPPPRPRPRIEEQHDPARDEPVGVGTAPLVDVPDSLYARIMTRFNVAVRSRAQHLAREAGPVREV